MRHEIHCARLNGRLNRCGIMTGALKSALHCYSLIISVKQRSLLINGRGSANAAF
jgi:hypothetical protein